MPDVPDSEEKESAVATDPDTDDEAPKEREMGYDYGGETKCCERQT